LPPWRATTRREENEPAVADRLHVVDDRQVDPSGQQEVRVQRVHHPGDRHRARGGDQRLGQHLPTEDPLQQGVGLSRPEEVDLDLLEIEQIDQLVHDCGTGRA
jgi:hypothetical protein